MDKKYLLNDLLIFDFTKYLEPIAISAPFLISSNKWSNDFNEVERAYHFDATKFGLWLRDKYCKKIKHIIEDVKTIVKANFKDKYISNPAKFKSAHADIKSESIFGVISLIMRDLLSWSFCSIGFPELGPVAIILWKTPSTPPIVAAI